MKGRKVNEYSKPNKNGVMQTNYAYHLTGTEQEIADFLASKSARVICKDDNAEQGTKVGDVLWIHSEYEGETIDNVVITKSGYAIADRSEERKLVALASRLGKAGEAMIQKYMEKKMRKAAVPSIVAKETETPVDLGDLD